MKSFKIAMCALSCLAVVATAQAAVPPHKWYADANVGYMFTDNSGFGFTSFPIIGWTDERQASTPIGLGSNLGYQFNNFFSVELGFIYPFVQQTSTQSFFSLLPLPDGTDTSITQTIFDVFATHFSLKGSVPFFVDHLQAFAKIGVAYTRASQTFELNITNNNNGDTIDVRSKKTSVDSFAPAFSLGLEYAIGDDYYVQLGWAFIPGKEVRNVGCNPAATGPVCTTQNIPAINEVYAGFGIRFN